MGILASGYGNFWKIVSSGGDGRLMVDGAFKFVVLDFSYNMKIFARTRTERFTDMLRREAANMAVAVSGPMYERPAYADQVRSGVEPVPPSHITTMGEAVERGKRLAGTSQPDRFYFAKLPLPTSKTPFWGYTAGFGDPPSFAASAIGGAGPLIVSRLPYGAGNVYEKGFSGPSTGDPGPALRAHLLQRNNLHLADISRKYPPQSGKVILASSSAKRRLLVGVQPDGTSPGLTYGDIEHTLLGLGFDNAVYLDGSSSATMMVHGAVVAEPAFYKNDCEVVAVGFHR